MSSRAVQGGLIWVLKLGMGVLFVVAGALKIRAPEAFAEEIANYQFLEGLSPLGAIILPTTEIVLGAALLIFGARSLWLQASAIGTALLNLLFTLGVTQAWIRGIDTSCGCFGNASGSISTLTVMRVVGLVSASILLFYLARKRSTTT